MGKIAKLGIWESWRSSNQKGGSFAHGMSFTGGKNDDNRKHLLYTCGIPGITYSILHGLSHAALPTNLHVAIFNFHITEEEMKARGDEFLAHCHRPSQRRRGDLNRGSDPIAFPVSQGGQADNLENSSGVCAPWGSEVKTKDWHPEEQSQAYKLFRTTGTTNIVKSEGDVARFEFQESQHYRKGVGVRIGSLWWGGQIVGLLSIKVGED